MTTHDPVKFKMLDKEMTDGWPRRSCIQLKSRLDINLKYFTKI